MTAQTLDQSASRFVYAPGDVRWDATAKFNPNQPRDKDGKWGTGGALGDVLKVAGKVTDFGGSMGVDRKDMPQLSGTSKDGTYHPSAEMTPKFLAQLRAKGVKVTTARVPAKSIKPTQASGGTAAIRSIADDLKSGKLRDTKPVVISADNRVLDGHHTWAGRLLADSEGGRKDLPAGMPVYKADLPMEDLLGAAEKFGDEEGLPKRGVVPGGSPLAVKPPQPVTETFDRYRNPDGSWAPERQQLHDKIVSRFLSGRKPEDHPVATFFGGGPASGKSALTSPSQAVKIDPDEIKGMLPEYQAAVKNGDPSGAAQVHEESSYLAATVAAKARQGKVSYTLDGTGDSSYGKMAAKVKAAKDAGYQVHSQYVTVDTGEAVSRAAARAQKTGRMVPEPVIRATHASVSSVFGQAVKNNLFDRTELYDNNGPAARLIAHTSAAGEFQVLDDAAYKSFLAKAGGS